MNKRLQILLSKLHRIEQEISGKLGFKEEAVVNCDFDLAADLRDLADAIKKYTSKIIDRKDKRPATSMDILVILEADKVEVCRKLGLEASEVHLFLNYKDSEMPVLTVSVKQGTNQLPPATLEWETTNDDIAVVNVEYY